MAETQIRLRWYKKLPEEMSHKTTPRVRAMEQIVQEAEVGCQASGGTSDRRCMRRHWGWDQPESGRWRLSEPEPRQPNRVD